MLPNFTIANFGHPFSESWLCPDSSQNYLGVVMKFLWRFVRLNGLVNKNVCSAIMEEPVSNLENVPSSCCK